MGLVHCTENTYFTYVLGSWDIQVGQQRKKHGQNCVSIGYIDDKKPKIF